MAISILQNGIVVREQAYGYANLEHMVPMRVDTMVPILSLTKSFVSLGVMILAMEQKLSLDDSVTTHLDLPDSWSEITIRHLLSRTSGLPRELPTWTPREVFSPERILREVAGCGFDSKPGETWSYSNLGYRTMLMRFLKHELTVIVLANENLLNVGNLAFRIADLYVDGPMKRRK